MANNVVDFAKRRDEARHGKKEQGLENMQKRFSKALPEREQSSKEKLLGLFKKTKGARTPKKKK